MIVSAATGSTTAANKASPTDAVNSWATDNQEIIGKCVDDAGPDFITRYRRLSGLGDSKYPIISFKAVQPTPPSANPTEIKAYEEAVATKKAIEDFYSQGMILQYGFNFAESIKSFLKVLTYDPNAAMAYWGIALASNSNINSTATENCDELAKKAALQARKLALAQKVEPDYSAKFTIKELDWQLAYADSFVPLTAWNDPVELADPALRNERNKNYKNKMHDLSQTYPDDLDAATLYANSLLNMAPWKWWNWPTTGKFHGSDPDVYPVAPIPTADASTALQVLNQVLIKDPSHIGANHFFIHAIEESSFSEAGIDMAERLTTLAPSSGHLVHMTSHIRQRVGDNAGSSAANYRAIQVDRSLMAQLPGEGENQSYDDAYPLHYLGHNIHFLTWTLSIEGRENDSLAMSRELIENTAKYAAKGWLCRNFSDEIKIKTDYYLAASLYFPIRFQNWAVFEKNKIAADAAVKKINDKCNGVHQGFLRHPAAVK